jgi:hypothetical protein
LRLFKDGLLLMAQDRFEEATSRIRAGIERNQENLPLNKDMQRVLERIARATAALGTPSATGGEKEDASTAAKEHFLVSNYRNPS